MPIMSREPVVSPPTSAAPAASTASAMPAHSSSMTALSESAGQATEAST